MGITRLGGDEIFLGARAVGARSRDLFMGRAGRTDLSALSAAGPTQLIST